MTGPCAQMVGRLQGGTKWLYGKLREELQVTSATQCCQNCDAATDCFHWSYNHQQDMCVHYGDDGYPEERPPWHEWVTGHSTMRKSTKHKYEEL